MYNYSPQTCLIKDIDGKIYNIIDLWQGKKVPVDLTTIQYSYAPKSCLVQNVDGTNVNVIDTILAVANGSGSGTSSLEEVIQARGKYSTLGERLDKDNEKVYEVINDKDFIPFEGEDIKVEHSKIGFTKDMQIEGMTYQNLLIDRVASANDINVFNHNYNKVSLKQGEGYIEVTSINENNDYTLLGYDVHLTQEPNLFKFNTQYLVMVDIEILENQTNASFCVGGFLNNTKNKKINSGRGIVAKVMETGSDFNGNNGWINIGSDSEASKGTKFRYYGGIALELPPDELSNKSIDELINKYWFGKFEGIKSVGEKESKISILSRNKNLFDESTLQSYLVDEWYNFESEGNSRSNSNFMIYEEKDVNSKVIMRGNRANEKAFTTTNKEKYYCQIGLNGDVKDNKIWLDIKLKPNTNYIMSTQFDESIVNCVKFKNIQINEGNKKLQYEKQKTDKKEILLPYEFGFKGLPSGAKDTTILKEDGLYIRQNIGKKSLSLTINNWFLREDLTNETFITFQMTFSEGKGSASTNDFLCNSLPNKTQWDTLEEGCWFDNNLTITLKKSTLSEPNLEKFKEWLITNNVEAYYVLATPIEHKIADLNSINLETFKDITYVSSENEIKPNLSFKAPVDVQATISTLRENNAQLSNELEVKTQELQEKDKELANEDDLLTAKDLDMDFRIFELEEQLTPEIAKLSMSHNSPYPMIKRCIEKGLYEKEDMLYKMNRYLHGKRLTQEEYDELKLMMG